MKKGPFLVVIGLALLAIAYLGWTWSKNVDNNVPGPSHNPTSTISFEKTGVLIRNNPGMKQGVWFLNYEEPGAPGLSVELAFNNNSNCTVGGVTVTCGEVDVPNGTRATLKGSVAQTVVTVGSLVAESVGASIMITAPAASSTVATPIQITGSARGSWFFEASFPIALMINGQTVTTTHATATSDWMTADFVPFTASIKFSVTSNTPAELVFSADNPSGLPQNDKEFRLPVILVPGKLSTADLYFYDPNKDKDAAGNILCSKQGLVKVTRNIPQSASPLKDVINLLLAGPSADESQTGATSEFPLAGVTLQTVVIKNSVATLTFADPNNKTGGGSCRASILWDQIEATAKQFPTVKQVKFAPAELFQP